MYLKRLEMFGFKSFAARTSLEFSPGITAVVGPNGAGKSNVADSMRWVLGEQSMRQLRGKKSDDIIFAGGQGKAPLGMVEVSLTLDNSTGWVPSDYNEIMVTRRSYRSGENEYLINKQKVRLKDVLLLLAQARIGHDSYTVVGQGLIDAALSLRAEERRTLFEEAAGIRPFQVQRADAENRLKQTEQNTERLRDIVSEIEPRLAPLAEQAKKAAEFSQVDHELHEVLLSWYALQWRRLQINLVQAESTEQEQARKVRQGELALQTVQEQANTLRGRRAQIQARIIAARKACAEANDLVQKLERDQAVNDERASGLKQQYHDFQRDERRLREQAIALQKQAVDQEEQCDLADESIDASAASLASLEGHVARAQKEYEFDERRLRNAQHDLVQVQARLSTTQLEVGRLQKQLGERHSTLVARHTAIAKAQQAVAIFETRLMEEGVHLDGCRYEEQQCMLHKQDMVKIMADSQQEIERLKVTLSEADRRKRTTTDRLNMLNNWRQSLGGYSDGVRALLRAPVDKISGVLGPVPRLGIVHAGMEKALEAALGPFMQAVVVQTLKNAQQALEYLQHAHAGNALLVWLERYDEDEDTREVRTIQYQVEEGVLRRFLDTEPTLKERISGFAWQYIQCEPRYIPLFYRMLHGVVLAQDLEAAHQLFHWTIDLSLSSDSDLPLRSIVTMNGEVLHVDGWLTGGGDKEGSPQGLLAHERELRELPQHLEEINGMIEQLHAMMSAAQRKQEIQRIELNTADKELQKVTGLINELNRKIRGLQRELEQMQTEIRLSVSVEQQLAIEVAGLEQEGVSAQERIHGHEKLQREMSGLVDELESDREERASNYRRQQDQLGRERTTLAVKRQEARSLRQHLAIVQQQAQEMKQQIEQQLARSKEAEQKHQSLLDVIAHQKIQLEQTRQSSQVLVAELLDVEHALSDVDQLITTQEQQRSSIQQVVKEQETVYRRSLLERQKAQDAVETLLNQLHEEMNITDPKELSQLSQHHMDETVEMRAIKSTSNEYAVQTLQKARLNEQDVDARQRDAWSSSIDASEDRANGQLSEEEEAQLRKYRRRIEMLRARLKAIGGCDEHAPQLYEETKTRYEFLSAQISDLDQAAHQLHMIIGQLDITMAKQFEETFYAINTHFRDHFTTLFNGGTARLELINARSNDDDSTSVSSGMPTGVDVIVQPPGKKVQDLSLLSGGERALVSAALLFALLEINPPPFCLLDEVDAALDESNVTRFCDILKQLARQTQFIVITHNRVTMTSAQAIYGVTMRESASRLLSLRLDEISATS